MRWIQAGAHLALQARTRVLNGELEDAFRRRWPGFQPLPGAERGKTGDGALTFPASAAATASPPAHVL